MSTWNIDLAFLTISMVLSTVNVIVKNLLYMNNKNELTYIYSDSKLWNYIHVKPNNAKIGWLFM